MTTETHRLNFDPNHPGADEQILAKGTVLDGDRYEILKILGLGGMGSVYLARDMRFREITRYCAIKEMTITSPDPSFRKLAMDNFKREANTLASMNHPAIVKIYDFFNESNRVYLVMEYIDGDNLDDIVTKLPDNEFLAEDRVLKWGIQVCEVLTFLHNHNPPYVYRDLKPPNLILKSDGSDNLVLIDFGIAKVFQEGQKGTMMGTEGYSPPEQYKGLASPQGDIYALGATMHHLLTRRDPKLEPPFSFHDALPRRLNPTVTELTEQAIMKALDYDQAKRYKNTVDMKTALQKALDAKKQMERGGGQPFSGAPMYQQPPSYAQPTMPQAAPSTGYLQQDGPASMPQVGYQPQEFYGPMGGMSDILPVWSFRCEDEVRSSPAVGNGLLYIGVYDNNIYALNAKTGKFQWKYPTEGGIASTPCIYKDRVIFGSEDRMVYAVTGHNGKILWTCPTEGKVRSSVRVEFEHAFFGSDDGRLYAANVQSGRVVWRFEGGGPIRSTPLIDEEIVYTGCEDGHLYALDLQTGKMKWKFRTNQGVISSPTIYDNLVLFGSKDRTFYALDKRTGWSIWKQMTNNAIYSSPSVKDDFVYFGSTDGHLYCLEVKSGKIQWKFRAGSQINSSPAVSDDAVFFGTSAGEVVSVFIKNGRERWRFQTNGTVPSSPALGEGVVYIGSTDHYVYALPA